MKHTANAPDDDDNNDYYNNDDDYFWSAFPCETHSTAQQQVQLPQHKTPCIKDTQNSTCVQTTLLKHPAEL